MKHFNPTQLNDYLKQTDTPPLLLDVREPWEFEQCQLENSMLMPMQTIPANFHQLESDKEIVVICHHGIRSRMVAQFLEHQGFSNLINLDGGIDAWAKQVDPTMATY